MRHTHLSVLVLAVLASPVIAQTADEKQATIAFLRGLQTDSGAFLPAPKADKAGLRSTSSAVRAIKYFGGEVPNPKGAADYVSRCFDKSTGGFADTPGGAADVTTTAIGLMAAVELNIPTAKLTAPAIKFLDENAHVFEDIRITAAGLEAVDKKSDEARRWLEEIAKLRNADGTYGKGPGMARATGGSVVAVLRLGGKLDQRDNVVKALKAGQRADGGFGKEEGDASDLETSYRVCRAFVMLKEKPDLPKLRGFIARCRNADGGYGVMPGQASTVSGTYFASYILHYLIAE